MASFLEKGAYIGRQDLSGGMRWPVLAGALDLRGIDTNGDADAFTDSQASRVVAWPDYPYGYGGDVS